MLSNKLLTFSAISIAAVSTTALAGVNTSKQISINSLPDSGLVSLQGTVSDKDSNREFSLQDANGDNIDIELSNKAMFKEGDKVQVTGSVDSNMWGLGSEINNAELEILSNANKAASSSSYKKSNKNFNNANAQDKLEVSGDFLSSSEKLEHDRKNVSAYTTNEIEQDAQQLSASVKQGYNDTKNALALGENEYDFQATDGEPMGRIDKLPENGSVALSGEISAIDVSDNSFILKDNVGDTIDVHVDEVASLEKGDSVIVYGEVKSEIAGIGEEIEAQAIVISSN